MVCKMMTDEQREFHREIEELKNQLALSNYRAEELQTSIYLAKKRIRDYIEDDSDDTARLCGDLHDKILDIEYSPIISTGCHITVADRIHEVSVGSGTIGFYVFFLTKRGTKIILYPEDARSLSESLIANAETAENLEKHGATIVDSDD